MANRIITGIVLVGLGLGGYFVWNTFLRPPSRGEAYENRLFEGKTILIRAVAYHEDLHGSGLPGGIHVFDARPRASADWTTLFEHRYDDPRPLPDGHAEFPTDQIAFFYLGSRYFVTTDGARSWSAWEAPRPIFRVDLSAQGMGTMVAGEDSINAIVFETADWGRKWTGKNR